MHKIVRVRLILFYAFFLMFYNTCGIPKLKNLIGHPAGIQPMTLSGLSNVHRFDKGFRFELF